MMKRVFLLLVIGLTIASCGQKDSSEENSSKTTIETVQHDTEKQNAEQLVLTQSDMPSGWSRKTDEARDVASKKFNKNLNDCLGLPDPSTTETANVNGERFAKDSNTISSNAIFFRTSQLRTQRYTEQFDPKNATCIAEAFNVSVKLFINQNGLPNIEATSSLALLPGFENVNDVISQRIISKVQIPAQDVTVYTDFIGLTRGRAINSMVLTYLNAPPPLELEQTLLTKLRAHMDSVGASPSF